MAELTYRDLQPSDAGALHDMMSDWSIVRQMGGWPWPPSRDVTDSRSRPYPRENGFVWGVFLGHRLAGTVGVTGEWLAYALSPRFQGQGIGSRAVRHAIDQGFARFEIDRITANTWDDNHASYALLRKLGFTHWQTHYEHAQARGLPVLCHEHRLSRHTWIA
jgi:RimJ/RimL family protein N-acetyltransferase